MRIREIRCRIREFCGQADRMRFSVRTPLRRLRRYPLLLGGPSGWLAYVEVEDIHTTTQKAKSLGGKIMKEPFEVMGVGWLSFIQDPTGAVLGSPN
jgi:hypothetical protein